MKVAVVGSRNARGLTVDQVISHIPLNASLLISGGACGVDTLAEQAAQELRLPIRVLRPDYQTHGRLAPLVRDDQIVQQADLVLAFWDGNSSGTAYTLRRCVDFHTPFRIIQLKL